MSYDLRIMFSGLSMYVPQEKDLMHVLLPDASGHVHGGEGGGEAHHRGGVEAHEAPEGGEGGTAVLEAPAEPEAEVDAEAELDEQELGAEVAKEERGEPDGESEVHFTRLIYDAAYENPKATQLSRTYVMRDFTGRVLDLSGLTTTGEGLDTTVPDEIPSLSKVNKRVDPALVQGNGVDPRLAGRVVLGSGAITDCMLGARFSLAGEEQRITVRSQWTVRGVTDEEDVPAPPAAEAVAEGNGAAENATEGNGTAENAAEDKGATENGAVNVEVNGAGAGNAAAARRPVLAAMPDSGLPNPLYPIGQTIHLMVFNTTDDEFPPHGPGFNVPAPEGDAHHFTAYFPLTVEGPTRHDEIPLVVADREVDVVVDGVAIAKRGPLTVLGMRCVQSTGVLA